MSRRWYLVIACLVVLLLALGGAVWYAQPRKTALTIEVTGTRGLPFKGTAEVDGVAQELTGAVPAQLVLEGYRVTYSLTSAEDSGEIRVKPVVEGIALGSIGSGNPPKNGVRGWVMSVWGRSLPKHWIEPFDREAGAKWLAPPPE